jgi:hypothetical protein
MEDFPRDLLEFEARFSTEKACREYLFQLRWPDGLCCPRCGGRKSWPKSEVLLECASCDYRKLGDGTDNFPGYAQASDALVPGHLVSFHPETVRAQWASNGCWG